MRKMLIIIILLLSGTCYGATHYVDFEKGSNTNDGSQAYPWKECPGTQNPVGNITTGWIKIPVASTILLAAGQTWVRPISITSTWFSSPVEESQRITIKSSSTITRAKFNLVGQSTYYGILVNMLPYFSFEYLEIYNVDGAGGSDGTAGFHIGISTGANYTKVRYCYIHNITSADSVHSYGVEVNNSNNVEISYNKISNVEEKLIELYRSAKGSIHHNYLFSTPSSPPTDHGVVITGDYNNFYANIIYMDPSASWRTQPAFGVKIDGIADGSSSSNNKIHNNLIIGYGAGIGLIDIGTGNNSIINNTIYSQGRSNGDSYSSVGINIGLGGTQCKNNIIRNNIIYYVASNKDGGSNSNIMSLSKASSNVSGNIIQNNIYYYNGTIEKFRIGGTGSNTSGNVISTWNGSNGNVFDSSNTVAVPGFSGGIHPVSNLPTGFDSNWRPNYNGLSLSLGSKAIGAGIDAGSPYNIDIVGFTRPAGQAWDVGSYQYQSNPIIGPIKIPATPSSILIQ